MNVLILTPDAVGSTLLQRLITVSMQFYPYDRQVINLHELTNGVVKYHNDKLQQEVLGKTPDTWGYYQSLEHIVELLESVDHYKVSRLAHYHIKNRKDEIDQQIPFYQYLNNNFYIISCRRHNVFEHALSWCLSKVTKKLNVYAAPEKINSFFELYKDGIDIDPNSLLQSLNAYKDYLHWCNNHFNVANYFYYDEHLNSIEKYIANLPIFPQRLQLTWNDNFEIDFKTWNKCHRLTSDIGALALDQPEKFQSLSFSNTENSITVKSKLAITDHASADTKKTTDLVSFLSESDQKFLQTHNDKYQQTLLRIQDLVDSGIMTTSLPIKKQTLAEKKHIIRNYTHLLEVYNQWVSINPDVASNLDMTVLDKFSDLEKKQWDVASQEISVFVEQKTG